MHSSDNNANLFFTTLMLWVFLPIGFGILGFLFWFILAQIRRLKLRKTYKRNAIANFIVLTFMVYPIITNYTFELFNCLEIEGKYLLKRDLTVECWKEQHIGYIIIGGLPGLALWVVGFPAIIFSILYRHRKCLNEPDTLIKYGLFYVGLSDKMFYWEIIIINSKKVLIIVASILLSRTNKVFLSLLCFLILYLNVLLCRYTSPYTSESLNSIEACSIIAGVAVILIGIFFLEPLEHNQEHFALVLFMILIGINLWYIILWFT